MTSLLNRYIAKTVIGATLLVILVVMVLTYIVTLLDELKDIGVGEYGVAQAALHTLFVLPHYLYQFFPMLVLLGGLLGLGILAANQELIVMRISGLSVRQVMQSIFGAAIIFISLGLLVGELVAPRALYLADKYKSISQSGGQAVATYGGVWIHEGNNFFHIERVMPHHHLEGMTRYEFDAQHRLLATYYAKTLDYDAGKWQIHDLDKTVFTQDHASSLHVPAAIWTLALNPNLLNIGMLSPEEMSLDHLWEYTRHLVKNGLQAAEFQFNFWKRVFQPFTILIMLFLAIPFIFAAPRSTTMGLRLLLGVLVGFTFYMLDALVGQLSVVFQLSPIIAALFPIAFFAVIGYGFMLRIRS